LYIDELKGQSGAGTAKKPQIDTEPSYFAKFEPLGANAVKEYLRVFLALDKVEKEVLEYIAKLVTRSATVDCDLFRNVSSPNKDEVLRRKSGSLQRIRLWDRGRAGSVHLSYDV
jgi:hypothetical protein